jgi:hypothetical protein
MTEKLIPVGDGVVPSYGAAAAQHGALPTRNGPPSSGAKPLPRGPFPLDIPVLNHLKGKRVILASASPRRKQLLATVRRSLPTPISPQQLTPIDWTHEPRNPSLHETRKPIKNRTRSL